MKTIEELEAELETVTRERDLSLSAWESAGMTGRTAQSAMLELARQLEEARAEVGRFRDWYRNAFGGPSKRETPWDPCACDECESLRRLKDEQPVHPSNLTDVVSLLEDERDELLVRVANQEAELRATRDAYNEARANVDRLKLSARLWADDIDAVKNAYRRGAEAMREACASAMRPIMRSMISRTEAAQTIRALPIPEEP